MKHNTSYKFYVSFLKRGLLQEYYDDVDTIPEMPSDLEKLKKLYDDRAITKEEYEAKKKEILDKI